jgi:hypothetical protein
MSFDAISLILDVATAVRDANRDPETITGDRRVAVAGFYELVANTLAEVVIALRAGEVPHGPCAQMRSHAEKMPEVIADLIGEREARELSQRLMTATEVELLLIDLDRGADREAGLADLEKAVSLLRGSAASVRAIE